MAGGVISLPAKIIEPVMTGLQKLLGIKLMPWVFLFPNMLAVILFSLLPVFINIHYSFTGSDRLYPQDRPFVGGPITRPCSIAATISIRRPVRATCSGGR